MDAIRRTASSFLLGNGDGGLRAAVTCESHGGAGFKFTIKGARCGPAIPQLLTIVDANTLFASVGFPHLKGRVWRPRGSIQAGGVWLHFVRPYANLFVSFRVLDALCDVFLQVDHRLLLDDCGK
jgi:hypothetical protein